MTTKLYLSEGWEILQDVHESGEKLKLYTRMESYAETLNQMSEWEPLKELKHLQLVYSENPYFGRELRYFNQASWWYKKEFEMTEIKPEKAVLTFSNVDYYCKVWLNGEYLGEHEGYSMPFSFDISKQLRCGEKNLLVVKVSSPWDKEVECGDESRRTILVKRNMVKGTYEHSDTFIQRDVNPVGIYGKVFLELFQEEYIDGEPELTYELDRGKNLATLQLDTELGNLKKGKEYAVKIEVREKDSGRICGQDVTGIFAKEGKASIQQKVMAKDVKLWNTWDHGGSWMYEVQVSLEQENKRICQKKTDIAFREVGLERTAGKTCFYLNGRRFYIRGTSYFPDNYISAMTKERYWRDLLNMKAAGFNLIRVHVHIEQNIFYELCDQLGFAVIQDSDYNWTHPSTDEWAERFIKIYKENIKMLKNHPSIICWIGMNEPGCVDPDGKTQKRFMEENPGPRLYEEIKKLDGSRPIIKGSFCENDIFSGDSHNYLGSLSGGEYGDIYGTTEKLNTEYGFDAPGCLENLKQIPKAFARLGDIKKDVQGIQEYQYKLLKYYTEHYRIQKYNPCSGYIQFMFIDLSPQSFYGLYDWWGIPKRGLQAMLESNGPVGVFAKYKNTLDAIYVVNDSDESLEDCQIQWVITDGETGNLIEEGAQSVDVEADQSLKVVSFSFKTTGQENWNIALRLIDACGQCIAKNKYENIFYFPKRIAGHPDRVSQELGMRIYWG